MTYNNLEINFREPTEKVATSTARLAADAWSRDNRVSFNNGNDKSQGSDRELNLVLNKSLNDNIYGSSAKNPFSDMRNGQNRLCDSLQSLDRALTDLHNGITGQPRNDITRAITNLNAGLDDLRNSLSPDQAGDKHKDVFRDPMNNVRLGRSEVRDALDLIKGGDSKSGIEILKHGMQDIRQGLGPIGDALERLEQGRPPLPHLDVQNGKNGPTVDLKGPLGEHLRLGLPSPGNVLRTIGKVAHFFGF